MSGSSFIGTQASESARLVSLLHPIPAKHTVQSIAPRVMRTPLAILLCLGLNACFPYHYTYRSGVSGTVINAQSRKPISGASVSIASSRYQLKNGTASTHTLEDGAFYIPPFKQWGILIVGEAMFVTTDTASFRCTGYTDLNKDVFNHEGADAVKQLGIIALKPK